MSQYRWPSYAEDKHGPDAIFWMPDEDIVESDPDELSDEEKERRRKRNQKRARQRRRQRTRDALKGKP